MCEGTHLNVFLIFVCFGKLLQRDYREQCHLFAHASFLEMEKHID